MLRKTYSAPVRNGSDPDLLAFDDLLEGAKSNGRIPPEAFEKRNSNISTAQTSFTDCTYPLLISGRSKSQGHIEEWLFIIQASTRPFGLFCL